LRIACHHCQTVMVFICREQNILICQASLHPSSVSSRFWWTIHTCRYTHTHLWVHLFPLAPSFLGHRYRFQKPNRETTMWLLNSACTSETTWLTQIILFLSLVCCYLAYGGLVNVVFFFSPSYLLHPLSLLVVNCDIWLFVFKYCYNQQSSKMSNVHHGYTVL
jgi:hypothetical protein